MFWVPREIDLCFCSKTQWQMFLLISGRRVGAHPDGHQRGVSLQISIHFWEELLPGAIIGDGDRKRAQIPLLGLSPWYGTIFLLLEQIAPSPVTHAHICCEDFCVCREGEMTFVIPKIFVMSCSIYHWTSYVTLLLLKELHISSLQVSHMCFFLT